MAAMAITACPGSASSAPHCRSPSRSSPGRASAGPNMKTALALGSLFLGAFAVGTTEFVPAGLVPSISFDLGVSIPTAGLLISAYAASVAIGGPLLSLLTSRFARKPVILILMGIFFFGHVFAALAPNFGMLMLSRIIIALTHGSYFGLMAILSVSLVPPDKQGIALAFTFRHI